MGDVIEAAARALYDREKERAALCSDVFSLASGRPVEDRMEPWEECRDVYLGDARAALEAAVDRMGWPEIRAYQSELRKGQSIYEDAGGYFLRAIRRLFGLPEKDEEVITYQRAASALIAQADNP